MEIISYPRISVNQSVLTAEHLRSVLIYDPETGEFYWREHRPNRIMHKPLGRNNGTGYLQIRIQIGGKCRHFLAHRLAWLYIYGVWPNSGIDHIDRNRQNNRISNLREVSVVQNNRNNSKRKNCTSKFLGVCWHKASKKWHAQINHLGKSRSIGTFDTEIEAAFAYNKAALERDPTHCSLNQV
jgi:hypothetical protein